MIWLIVAVAALLIFGFWIKGSPLSERALVAGQYVGLAMLVTLMSLAFYNDIVRIVAS